MRGRALLLPLALAVAACAADEPAPGPAASAAQPAARPAEAAPPLLAPRREAPAAAASEGWNAAQIDWQPYAQGLERAKAEGKPVCLVLYTDWCPHCQNYSRVFDDPRVVERSRSFVMMRFNADQEREIANRYAPDGGYVPRTFFLAPDGALQADVRAPRPKFMYFYDEDDPASLLAGMSASLLKVAP